MPPGHLIDRSLMYRSDLPSDFRKLRVGFHAKCGEVVACHLEKVSAPAADFEEFARRPELPDEGKAFNGVLYGKGLFFLRREVAEYGVGVFDPFRYLVRCSHTISKAGFALPN